MAQKPVPRGEVGCACVAREVSAERGGMGERLLQAALGGARGGWEERHIGGAECWIMACPERSNQQKDTSI